MMRRRRLPFRTADEYDALTGWRRFYHWQKGELKRIKRRVNRRERRTKRVDIEEGLAE